VVEFDLCDATWHAVRVGRDGWEVVAAPSHRFLRTPGMLPLPEPRRGDGEPKLRRYLALDDTNYRLVLGYIVGALCPSGPYPILAIHGEQGSGKSTLVRMIRRLVDPNQAGDRSKPKDEQDLMIAASNSWLVCFDNMSRIDDNLSDALCRIATGAGFGTRTHYTNGDETMFQVCRPQMVNGIPNLACSGDLVDRCITVMLPPREEARTVFEADLWAAFEADLPEMLGFLHDAVSCALRRLNAVQLSERPRLADFARWVEAAAPALGWASGAFLANYLANRRDGAAALVEGDALTALLGRVVSILAEPFQGTATQLHSVLASHANDDEKKAPDRPKNARALSTRLRGSHRPCASDTSA
jgi:energy-coupling factor transporter ATP-binding protein EcfA2